MKKEDTSCPGRTRTSNMRLQRPPFCRLNYRAMEDTDPRMRVMRASSGTRTHTRKAADFKSAASTDSAMEAWTLRWGRPDGLGW